MQAPAITATSSLPSPATLEAPIVVVSLAEGSGSSAGTKRSHLPEPSDRPPIPKPLAAEGPIVDGFRRVSGSDYRWSGNSQWLQCFTCNRLKSRCRPPIGFDPLGPCTYCLNRGILCEKKKVPPASARRAAPRPVASSGRVPAAPCGGARLTDANRLFEPRDAAAAPLTGGPALVPGVNESTAVLFWRAELEKAKCTAAAAVKHEKFCESMYLESLECALIPAGHRPIKRRKVSKAKGPGSGS